MTFLHYAQVCGASAAAPKDCSGRNRQLRADLPDGMVQLVIATSCQQAEALQIAHMCLLMQIMWSVETVLRTRQNV